MLAISEYMRSQGYAPADAEHTRIPGIWEKLGTLYNLPALDERVGVTSTSGIYYRVELVYADSHFESVTGRHINR